MRNKVAVKKKVVVFFGLIASGKSFAAKGWAKRHNFPYCNTDVVRKQLFGMKTCMSGAVLIAQDIYSPAFTRLTYDAVLDFAEKALANSAVSCVVLDGSYQARAERERVQSRFEGRADIVFVLCSCSEEVVKARLAKRALEPAAVSDGNWTIYLRQKEVFEHPDGMSVGLIRRFDTEQTESELMASLDNLLQNKPEVKEG